MSDSAQVYARRVVCVVVLFWLLVYAGLLYVKAQEQDATYPQTKTWVIQPQHEQAPSVWVIDTAGVCLYVVHPDYIKRSYTIAAVPKTVLKPGIGCQ